MDLPHSPSTAEQLYGKSYTAVHEFAIELESKPLSLDFRTDVKRRKYGARVDIYFFPTNFCQCTEKDCLQGPYVLNDQTFRVKCDWGFEALQHWLKSLKKFADAFDRST